MKRQRQASPIDERRTLRCSSPCCPGRGYAPTLEGRRVCKVCAGRLETLAAELRKQVAQ